MATTPTQDVVPSESPRDLKYNAGKIDEFVTSFALKYSDRFNNEHYTIEGLRWLASQAISQFGWIPFGTFQAGASITLPNQILKDTTDGEYYRWDGQLPKTVPSSSTPSTSGGVGVNAWISLGDSILRTQLASETGYQLIPSIQIQSWKNEGDIRGWGAIDGAFNDDAIEAALASSSPGVKLGGRGFVSKTLRVVKMRSNKVLHSGTINAQFANGTVQENMGIILPDVNNAKVIDVDVTGTLDGGIFGYGGSDIFIDGVNIHDIGFSARVGECGMGIWFGDYRNYGKATDGISVQNCTTKNIGGVGIMRGDGVLIYNAVNAKVRHNRIQTTNRMGISLGSDVLHSSLYGNNISDTLLASIDIEPDANHIASNIKVFNNRCTGFGARYFTEGSGVGQTFGIDVHANTSYVKVYNNTLSAGAYATEAFHIGNNAQEIDIYDNDVIGGAVTMALFVKTYDGAGSKFIRITRNRAKTTCKSFADIAMSEDVYLSDNVFSGNSTAGSYFLRVSTTSGLNVIGNRSSSTTNFIVSSSTGAMSNVKVMNNNISSLSDGINMLASGSLSGVLMTGNNVLCPADSIGIRLDITGSGTISNINLRGNSIPLSTVKMRAPLSVTGWDMYTVNNKFDVATAYNGMHIYELANSRVNQYFNGNWQY